MTRLPSLRSSKIRRFVWCSVSRQEESATSGGGMSQHIPGKAEHHSTKHARRRFADGGELYIRRRQAGWADDRLRNPGSVFQSAHRYERSPIRLGEVYLDWIARTDG